MAQKNEFEQRNEYLTGHTENIKYTEYKDN